MSYRKVFLATVMAVMAVAVLPLLASEAGDGFSVEPISDALFARMQGRSYGEGCPVSRSDLRHLRVPYYNMEGERQVGEIVCHKSIAQDLIEVFRELYRQKYPIGSIRLMDDYDGDDERSMRDNNTSCFCFRKVAGTQKLSKHAQGMAIDINPLYNPCCRTKKDGTRMVQPATAARYCDRSQDFPCKIDRNDLCYRLFVRRGFQWGGAWKTVKDYQHFEK